MSAGMDAGDDSVMSEGRSEPEGDVPEQPGVGQPISRREALKRAGGGALGAMGMAYALPSPVLSSFFRRVQEGYEWAFLRPDELDTMTALADSVIPADDRSGSASDAGTVEYVDFVLSISDGRRQAEWREGLRWLDLQARRLEGESAAGDAAGGAGAAAGGSGAKAGAGGEAPDVRGAFARASDEARARILEQVAWPEEAPPGLDDYADWFTDVRDLVGAGFFSSRMGVEDLGYRGNVMRPRWDGAPPEALDELGLSYEAWDRQYGEDT